MQFILGVFKLNVAKLHTMRVVTGKLPDIIKIKTKKKRID